MNSWAGANETWFILDWSVVRCNHWQREQKRATQKAQHKNTIKQIDYARGTRERERDENKGKKMRKNGLTWFGGYRLLGQKKMNVFNARWWATPIKPLTGSPKPVLTQFVTPGPNFRQNSSYFCLTPSSMAGVNSGTTAPIVCWYMSSMSSRGGAGGSWLHGSAAAMVARGCDVAGAARW